MLPKLIAARKSSQTSLNMSSDPASSIYSSTDSGFYSASECSTPPTPSYPSRGHFRFPSSTSSLSSSPPTHEIIEAPNSSGKLPKLTEEPIEREYDFVNEESYRCSCKSLMSSLNPVAILIYRQAMSNTPVTQGTASFPRLMTLRTSTSAPMTLNCG